MAVESYGMVATEALTPVDRIALLPISASRNSKPFGSLITARCALPETGLRIGSTDASKPGCGTALRLPRCTLGGRLLLRPL